jgi:hypothetical protein
MFILSSFVLFIIAEEPPPESWTERLMLPDTGDPGLIGLAPG